MNEYTKRKKQFKKTKDNDDWWLWLEVAHSDDELGEVISSIKEIAKADTQDQTNSTSNTPHDTKELTTTTQDLAKETNNDNSKQNKRKVRRKKNK